MVFEIVAQLGLISLDFKIIKEVDRLYLRTVNLIKYSITGD
jgi:hypothetical protein